MGSLKLESLRIGGSFILCFALQGSWAQAATAQMLSLKEAESLALRDEPTIERFNASAGAMAERAIAKGQLPDPKLRFGLMNFPTDTFNRTQEPMTQVQLGVQQSFPRGDSLGITARQSVALSAAQRDLAADRTLKALQEVRLSWLELFYWQGAQRIVEQNSGLFSKLVEVTQQQYAVGRHNQQDVIRAQLERSLLDDRLEKIGIQQAESRAVLTRWTGPEAATRSLPGEFPRLPEPPSRALLENALTAHPLIRSDLAKVTAGQEAVSLAREAYKPGWALGVNYGFRGGENFDGSERADFLSAFVTVDLPIFRSKRQDRQLSASQFDLQATRYARDERLRQLQQQLDGHYARWRHLSSRAALFKNTLLAQSRENAQAALLAYQNDVADFATLIRARITELDTQLQALRIRVDRAKAQVRLLYLAGGAQ